MKLALVSLNQVWEDKNANLALCEKYVEKATLSDIDLIIFPEMTLTGFSTNISIIAENYENNETIKKFSTIARKHNIAIVFGIVIKDANKALNKSIFIDKNGNMIGEYTKVHPFTFAGEDQYFNAGNHIESVHFDKFNIGLTICYDLRFPELYTGLAKNCDLIINIANWPSKRIEHWNTLLKARAIENQIFMIGVNRIGIDGNDLEYIESSNIFNANGEQLDYEQIDDMKIYSLDIHWTQEFKNKFNTTNDRRIKLYKEIL